METLSGKVAVTALCMKGLGVLVDEKVSVNIREYF
jgi:hypothetical protein